MDFIEAIKKNSDDSKVIKEHLFLKRGRMSIQASEFHYCEPRENLDISSYKSFEIGVICHDKKLQEQIDKLIGYCYFDDIFDMKLYEYVPKELVNMIYKILKGDE